MKKSAEVIVVGSGIAGSATAFFLTRLGTKDVLLLDKGAWHPAQQDTPRP